jgi:hypothetical protein
VRPFSPACSSAGFFEFFTPAASVLAVAGEGFSLSGECVFNPGGAGISRNRAGGVRAAADKTDEKGWIQCLSHRGFRTIVGNKYWMGCLTQNGVCFRLRLGAIMSFECM